MVRTADGWKIEYQRRQALWIHDGNPARPHVLLDSGLHSNGFFKSKKLMDDPNLVGEIALDLVKRFEVMGVDLKGVDRVIGPAMGAIKLVHEVARQIGLKYNRRCLSSYTEEEGEGAERKAVFKETQPLPGECILPVDDVLTTGQTLKMTVFAAERAGGIVLSSAGFIVNRSGFSELRGLQGVALIEDTMPMWEPAKCRLCARGSVAIPPEESNNWMRLNATY